MGVDPETEDVMGWPPRGPGDRVIDRAMWSGVLFVGAVMALVTLATIDLYLPGGLVPLAPGAPGTLENARTAGFTVLVLAQLFNCLNARSETASAFRRLFVNRWLWAAIGVSVLLQVAVVHVGGLSHAFSTTPLSGAQWAVCVVAASGVLWASEARKAIRRTTQKIRWTRSTGSSTS